MVSGIRVVLHTNESNSMHIHAYRVISAVWVIAERSEANYYKMAKTTQWLKAIQNYIRNVKLNISTGPRFKMASLAAFWVLSSKSW